MALRTTESADQHFSAAHIAVDLNDLSLLHFLESLGAVDFDMGNLDGETPLILAISRKHDDIVRFLL